MLWSPDSFSLCLQITAVVSRQFISLSPYRQFLSVHANNCCGLSVVLIDKCCSPQTVSLHACRQLLRSPDIFSLCTYRKVLWSPDKFLSVHADNCYGLKTVSLCNLRQLLWSPGSFCLCFYTTTVVSRQFLSVHADNCCGLQTVSLCDFRQLLWSSYSFSLYIWAPLVAYRQFRSPCAYMISVVVSRQFLSVLTGKCCGFQFLSVLT